MPCQALGLVPVLSCWEPLAAGYTPPCMALHPGVHITACTGEGTHIRCSSFFIFFPKKKEKVLSLLRIKPPHIIRLRIPTPRGDCSRAGTRSVAQPRAAPVTPRAHGQWRLTRLRLWVEQNLSHGDTPAAPGYKGWPVLTGAGFPLLFSCDINGNDPGFMNPRWKMSGVESRAGPEVMFPFARLTLSRACVAIWNLGQGLVVFPVSKTASTCAVQTKIIVMKLLQLLTSVPSQSVRKRGLFPVCPNKQAVFGVCLHTVGQEEGCAVYKRSRARNTASIAQLYHRWGDTNHVV